MTHCEQCQAFVRDPDVAMENKTIHEIEMVPAPQGTCHLHPPTVGIFPQGAISAFPTVKTGWYCLDAVPIRDRKSTRLNSSH